MLKYQKTKLLFYFLSFHVYTKTPISEGFNLCFPFQTLSHCKCDRNRNVLNIRCGSTDLTIAPYERILLQCNNGNIKSSYKEFKRIGNIGTMYEVKILNCSLNYNDSIKDFLNYMSTWGVKAFEFASNQRFLHKLQFDGLQGVSHLNFTVESSAALAVDLFENMPNVEFLEFYTNQTPLPKGIFDSLNNLRSMMLDGQNHSMEFPDGIFGSLKNMELVLITRVKKLILSKDIFSNNSKIKTLQLIENDIRTLQSGIFDNLTNLSVLLLLNNHLNDLPHDLFHKTSRLEHIALDTNRNGNFRTLPPEFLANVKSLITVQLSAANIEELPESLFYGSTNVVVILLYNNKLRHLPVNLFRDQKNLGELNLSGNVLINLPDDTFRTTTNLKTLLLCHNQFTEITDSIFKTLTSLEFLSLAYNKIKFIADDAFRNTKLKRLLLNHNQLTTISNTIFKSLNSLRHLLLNNNNFTYIASEAFCKTTALKILLLHYNYLNRNSTRTFINCLFSLVDLEVFTLHYNKIASINNADLQFSSTKNLVLDPSGNLIETIGLSAMDLKFKNKATILLHKNPIICDCKIMAFVNYLKNQSNANINTENLLCMQPMNFKGKQLIEIDPCDLTCSNADHALCPDTCRCKERTCNNTFIIDCSNSGLTQLPPLPTLDSFKFDKIVCDLHNNSLKSLQRDGSKTYDMIISLNLTGNILENIEASQLPINVEILDFRRNNLSTVPDGLFDAWSKNSSKLKEIYLANNHWPCGCESRSLLEFMQAKNNKIGDRDNLECFNSTNHRQFLMNFKVNQLCRDNKNLITIIASVIAFCALVSTVLVVLYYRFRDEIKVWLYSRNMCLCFVSIEELERDKEYDGFVSYSHKDKEFVQEELMPFLEYGPRPFKICDHERDWLVGDTIPEQIIKSVENSRRTLIILSDNYLESVWGRMEFQAAHQLAMKEKHTKLIIILYGEIQNTKRIDDELQAYLNMNTYLEWGNPWFWKKLLYAMPHSKHSKVTGELSNPNENAFNMINY